MLRLLVDQNLDHDILRGLIRRIPQLEAVTALEIGMARATDPDLLTWALHEQRIIITHDQKTMPSHAAKLLNDGGKISGLLVVPRSLPIHRVIEELELIITCSVNEEWENAIRYLPLDY